MQILLSHEIKNRLTSYTPSDIHVDEIDNGDSIGVPRILPWRGSHGTDQITVQFFDVSCTKVKINIIQLGAELGQHFCANIGLQLKETSEDSVN